MTGQGVAATQAAERAERILSHLDTNLDGEISEQEFLTGCLQDPDISNIIQ